jgi:hypothetical protein
MGFLKGPKAPPPPIPPPTAPTLASNQISQAMAAERAAAAAASGQGFDNTILTSSQGTGGELGTSAKGGTKALLGAGTQ